MRAPFTQLYIHCVWATWDRLPLITAPIQKPVYAAILDKCRELKCAALTIGGMPDHIHLLVQLHSTISVAELLKETKGASSHLVTHEIAPGKFFKWQGAYGAFTVSPDRVPVVKAYIERQAEHHSQNTLQEELEQTAAEVIGE